MIFTDDPVADFERHDAEQQKQLDKLPTCSICGEHIQDYYSFEISNELLCEECMNDLYRVHTDEFIDD